MGEANGNDLANVYLGGAKDQTGVIFLQKAYWSSTEIENLILQQLVKAEDSVAEFVEFNQRRKLDLYVESGGNNFESRNLFLFDRFTLKMTSVIPFHSKCLSLPFWGNFRLKQW